MGFVCKLLLQVFQLNHTYNTSTFQPRGFSSMLPLMELPSARLSWSCVLMLSPRPLRTSVPCALERRATGSRDLPSTGSSPTSCARVETSLPETELEESLFMETSLRMRTLLRSTLDLESCPWPTLDLTPTVLNFSSVPPRPNGLMESTSSSDRLWREWTS